MTSIVFANGLNAVVSDQMLTGGAVMTPGRWAMQVRYLIQYVPHFAASTDIPAFFLQTHPATSGDGPQRIDGPLWNSMTPTLWDASSPTAGWTTFTINWTVGAIDADAPPAWVGRLFPEYQLDVSGGAEEIDTSLLSDWPVLISRVRVAKS